MPDLTLSVNVDPLTLSVSPDQLTLTVVSNELTLTINGESLTLSSSPNELTLSATTPQLTLSATAPQLTLSVAIDGASDGRVKVTNADTTREFLDAKIVPGDGLIRTILNPGAVEDYRLDVRGFVETSGPTALVYGDIAADELLQRVGGSVVGIPISAVGVTDHDDLSNNGGAGSHATLTAHLADATIHFTEGSVNHQKRFYEGMSKSLLEYDDFEGPIPVANGIQVIPAGSSAGVFGSDATDKTDHPGVWVLSTGTATDGRVFLLGGINTGFHLGVGGVTRFGAWVRTSGVLSTAAQEYVLRAGILTIALPNTITMGVGFEYQFDQNGGRWQGITDYLAESSLDTGITVAVNTWYKLEFEVNADGTSVEFFIDDVSVGTLSTAANIPSGNIIDNYVNIHIIKLAGTAARFYLIDAYYLYQEINR